MHTEINWSRIQTYLKQEKRRNQAFIGDVDTTIEMLRTIFPLFGEFSHSRKLIQRIGINIMRFGLLKVVVPICPDYSHEGGRYTFRSLNDGVPLLATLHVEFLQKFRIPKKVLLLLADHEANNPALCRAVGKTSSDFALSVHKSVEVTSHTFAHLGFKVEKMTNRIENLREQEDLTVTSLLEDGSLRARIDTDTLFRTDLYQRIDATMSVGDMHKRTVTTIAQYIVFGRWAAQHGFVICNHTTTNLAWYLQTEVGVLHNPVSVY